MSNKESFNAGVVGMFENAIKAFAEGKEHFDSDIVSTHTASISGTLRHPEDGEYYNFKVTISEAKEEDE